jgi:putative aldouronate transport system substrate-binding protein
VSLTGPKGVNYSPQAPLPSITTGFFITKDCAYPEAAFRWMDFWAENDSSMVLRFGEKDVDWRWVNVNEGLMSPLGFPATFQEINMIWGIPQNKHWGNALGTLLTNSTDRKVKEEGTWNGVRWQIYERLNINDGKDAPEKVYRIIYTKAEEDSIREIRNSINTYRTECLALFSTGAMSLDRDWNTYLSNLDRMGLQRYLQVAQTAYTRTMQ